MLTRRVNCRFNIQGDGLHVTWQRGRYRYLSCPGANFYQQSSYTRFAFHFTPNYLTIPLIII
jgi:hypothetical protein